MSPQGDPDTPDVTKAITDFARSLESFAHRTTAAAALGGLQLGKPEQAIKALNRLPDDRIEPTLHAAQQLVGLLTLQYRKRGLDQPTNP